MKVDDTYRSFLTMISLGVNHGLLEFIKDLNEERAQIAHEARLQRQYELLGNFQHAAGQVADAQGADKEEKMKRFLDVFEKSVDDNSKVPESTKESLMRALEHCVVSGKNYENEVTFEQVIDESSLPDEEKMEYKAAYRNAMHEADRARQTFYVFQVDVDDNRAAVITAAVEKQLREQGIPAVGFYHDLNNGKCFLHVFDPSAADRAKALLENELCLRSIDNIRSEASLQAIAAVTKQDVITYSGLDKSVAGKMYELASGKHFPVNIESHEGKYSVMFLSDNRQYAEKILAEAAAQTGGYSERAGYAYNAEARQNERERVADYIGKIYSEPQAGDNLGYVIDISEKNAGNRIMFGPDSITHISKDGKTEKISRDENPLLFDDRVRTMVDNFAKDFVLIPAEDARRLGLYNENFQISGDVQKYIRDTLGTPPRYTKEDARSARIEQRFFSWAVKASTYTTAREIFQGMSGRLDSLAAQFKADEMKKIDSQFLSSVREEGSREAAQELMQKRKDSLEKDIDRFFGQGKDEVEKHISQFISSLENVHEQRPDILKSVFSLNQENRNELNRQAADKIRDAMESAFGKEDRPSSGRTDTKRDAEHRTTERDTVRRQEKGRNDRDPGKEPAQSRAEAERREGRLGDSHEAKQDAGHGTRTTAEKKKDINYYMQMYNDVKAQIALKTGLPSSNQKVAEVARRYVYGQNTMDTIRREAVPFFPEVKSLAAYAEAYVRVTTDRKYSLTSIPEKEFKELEPALTKAVMREALNPVQAEHREDRGDTRQEDISSGRDMEDRNVDDDRDMADRERDDRRGPGSDYDQDGHDQDTRDPHSTEYDEIV